MKPTPSGWPRFSSGVMYCDAAAAIDWLCRAFGFKVKLRIEGAGDRVEHCELVYGDGLIMVGQEDADAARAWKRLMRSPASVNGNNTQTVRFYVDDALAHCDVARANGARIVEEPSVHDYGPEYWSDRSYGALDVEGHLWWITERLRNPR